MPSGLITFLQNNPNCLRADLFVITLPTGTVVYIAEGTWDITVPSGTPGWSGGTTTFSAGTAGRWTRGPITSDTGFSLSANSMTLKCVPQPGTHYPGTTTGILSAALNGLFDAAKVTAYTAYMPIGQYGVVTAGLETKFFGYVEKVNKINRVMVEFEVQDPLFLLNEKVPKRLIQSSCPWSFGDSNCNPPGGISAFTQNFTAASGSTQNILTPVSAFSQPAGYFTQGIVTCLTGNNAGLSQTVKLHASGTIQSVMPWLLPVAVGDTFKVVAGCDKTATTCDQKFANKSNFGGAIDVPVPDKAL